MKIIPFSALEEPQDEKKEVPKTWKSALVPKQNDGGVMERKGISDTAIENLAQCLEIAKEKFEMINPEAFWDEIVSLVSPAKTKLTLEDVKYFISTMNDPKSWARWRSIYADVGGKYIALLEHLSLSNGFLHIHPSTDGTMVDVEELYPPPIDVRHSKFLAELVFYAWEGPGTNHKIEQRLINKLLPKEREFVDKYISICYIYFSTIFYVMRFVNPTIIDGWVGAFDLKMDSTDEEILEACDCWMDFPEES